MGILELPYGLSVLIFLTLLAWILRVEAAGFAREGRPLGAGLNTVVGFKVSEDMTVAVAAIRIL